MLEVLHLIVQHVVWDMQPSWFDKDAPFPTSRPFSQIKHNCQTVRPSLLPLVELPADCRIQGKWLTILRAQWSQNPDVYPHFTVRILIFHALPPLILMCV